MLWRLHFVFFALALVLVLKTKLAGRKASKSERIGKTHLRRGRN